MSKTTKFFRHPVKFFEDAEKKRKEFSKLANVKQPIFAFHINEWKKPILEEWMPGRTIIYVPFKTPDIVLEKRWLPLIEQSADAEVLVWGMNLPKIIRKTSRPIRHVEDGFIRSIDLGSNHSPPMSLNFDWKTPYFDASQSSDLEEILASYDFNADQELIQRSRALIDRIVEHGVSKYNHCGRVSVAKIYGHKKRPRVLVIGQVEDDASILYGCDKKFSNNDLVHIAYIENPESEIIYKPHPDVLGKKRKALSNPDDVAGICKVVTSDLSLADAFDTIDHVYTITSQAGFEALMRGIPVTTLGCPFYAGWGLTDDRQVNSRRGRQLSLEEVFAASFILYPRYYDPYYKKAITAEEAVDLIVRLKSTIQDRAASQEAGIGARSKWPAKKELFCFHVNDWKRPLLEDWFSDREFVYLPFGLTDEEFETDWEPRIRASGGAEVMIWGMRYPSNLKNLGIPYRYVEDGFIRSVGLGADNTPPLSLNFDTRTPYFDASEPSDLEIILATYDFDADIQLMARARDLMARVLSLNISKYNYASPAGVESLYGEKNRHRILVVGQVEDEASIRHGCHKQITNNDLVHIAYLEHPEADIFYKPHPDVLHGNRQMVSDPKEVQHICTVIRGNVSLPEALETIDHVYTVTSQAGFEALMRGIEVTTLGCPFYAGWGLTDDRQPNERRTRTLTVEQIFAAAYILYPRYFDPYRKRHIEAEEAVDILASLMRATCSNRQGAVVGNTIDVLSAGDIVSTGNDKAETVTSDELELAVKHLLRALDKRHSSSRVTVNTP
jgi:capsule polysaccharide export protein KpsC/LpsZ